MTSTAEIPQSTNLSPTMSGGTTLSGDKKAKPTSVSSNTAASNTSATKTPASNMTTTNTTSPNNQHFGLIMAIYLMGLFIGGIYVGMVSPVRTVIQQDFGIDDSMGIWMINIYTLFYAALIPIIGKLADIFGRKKIFVLCLAIFAAGALLCGASAYIGGFYLLLVGRVIQAIGACGMIPVANAEMGTAFPEEKRGMALGLAAGVAGIANILGSGAGSLILDLVGVENWAWLFFWCLPLCVLTMIGALVFLTNNTKERHGKLDFMGAVVFVLFVLLLLLAFRNVDFFDLSSFLDVQVWGMFLGAIVCVVLFRAIEHRAQDPIFHMEYLHSRPIVITMIVSLFLGGTMISMTLIPEFAEFVLNVPVGSGGYYVVIIGVFSIVGPMLAGKLIDKFGPKPVLIAGLIVQATGFVILALFVTTFPSVPAILFGLSIVGIGMGFCMGTPTNYMVLENVDASESTAAISTITLIRQIGCTIAPAILVGFVTNNQGIMGYQQMMLCVVIFSVLAILLMLFYVSPKKRS